MRLKGLVAATATFIGVGSVLFASPAQADHVLEFFPDGQCRWGTFTNPVRIDLFTPKFQVKRDSTGLVVSFTCHFKDIPAYVAKEDRGYSPYPEEWGDWYLPDRATAVRPGYCRGSADDLRLGVLAGKITPAGTATITCTL